MQVRGKQSQPHAKGSFGEGVRHWGFDPMMAVGAIVRIDDVFGNDGLNWRDVLHDLAPAAHGLSQSRMPVVIIGLAYLVSTYQPEKTSKTDTGSTQAPPANAPINSGAQSPYPTFQEGEPDQFVVSFGFMNVICFKSELQRGPQYPVNLDFVQPFKMYLEEGKLYVDVEVSGSPTGPSITIKHGTVAPLGPTVPDVDNQMSARAFEVVAKGLVVFQMILASQDRVLIHGIFR
jgi:hypothetical protein